jgi:hypothetical protein
MKEFIKSMLSEGGTISHKRWISVTVSAVICFTMVWGVIKYPNYLPDILHSGMIFVAVMSGVATVAQIVSLVNKTPVNDKDQPNT